MKKPEEKFLQEWKVPEEWKLSEEEYSQKVAELNRQVASRTEEE